MSKLKRWLYNKFLPAYCKEALLEENDRLAMQLKEQRQENERLNAYIAGLEKSMRYQKHITVHTGGERV